ncbi:Gldg family protein [Mucilaginibacter psychrotolerans]|uniref:ABC transporter n=1 Tax=Mucilaginibacter psychrotolerans TaxID=1524096 RepID=A0A4Y8SFA3_9SPHI|nr:Gldg family protein [Mucilaginibacter psychrotolerans]TFF37763.1 ABC transporter [Mucilaginibacter psychrotolerans]
MRIIFRIAKLELNTLFYSPIAWFLSIVFLFQCALSYTSTLQELLTNQELGGIHLQWVENATISVFGLQRGLLGDVLRKIYLYLPLLTMGLISREVNNGTIKLLYSSPVKISQIIWGKFLAMAAYNLVLIAILGIFVIAGLFNIEAVDLGFVLPGLFAIFLVLCAYAAIGLFMSCLTSYQVVAAISTLVIFAILAYIGTVWQEIDFVRDLTYFLSISGRAERMIYGLISTNQIIYFVIIVLMFISFSIIKLQSGRESKSALQITARYFTVLAIALAIGYITSLPGFIAYYDATRGNTQTLTPATQKIIKELGEEPLEVTSYINLVDYLYRSGQPEERNKDLDRWQQYMRFKPNIKLKYVYYYDEPSAEQELFKQYPGKSLKQIAEQQAYSYKTNIENFKTPSEIRKIIDLSQENNRYVMQLKYKGRTTFLRLFDDTEVFPSETEVGAAMKRLMVKLPKIVFVQGEFERSKDKLGDKDYGVVVNLRTYRNALINQGFDTDTVSLKTNDIPADAAALVIADPRTAFSDVALKKIRNFINAGGNLLITGEPGKREIINPVIEPLGVQMTDGMLIEKSKNNPAYLAVPLLTKAAAKLSKQLYRAFKDSTGIAMSGAAALSYQQNGSFKIEPLLVTNVKTTWSKKGKVVLDSADISFSPETGDEKKPFATALALSREINNKQQRIIITGDADFLSGAEFKRWGMANRDFAAPLFGWFTNGQFPIDTSRPDSKDNRLNLTYKQFSALKLVLMGLLPGSLLLFAAIFLIRRKRK